MKKLWRGLGCATTPQPPEAAEADRREALQNLTFKNGSILIRSCSDGAPPRAPCREEGATATDDRAARVCGTPDRELRRAAGIRRAAAADRRGDPPTDEANVRRTTEVTTRNLVVE